MNALTPRQLACLRLVADGYRTADIARRLHVSESYVRVSLTTVRRELGARTTTHAVAIACRRGLVGDVFEQDPGVRRLREMGWRIALVPMEDA